MKVIPYEKVKIGMVIVSICRRPIAGIVTCLGCKQGNTPPLISIQKLGGGYACICGDIVGMYEPLIDSKPEAFKPKRERKKPKIRFIRGNKK